MPILGGKNKPLFDVAKPKIRVERVPVSKLSSASASSSSSRRPSSSQPRLATSDTHTSKATSLPARPLKKTSASALRTSASPAPRFQSASPLPSGDERSRKRKASSPNVSTPQWDDESDGDDDWEDLLATRKKPRLNTGDIVRDPKRRVRNARSFAILGQEPSLLRAQPDGTTTTGLTSAVITTANGVNSNGHHPEGKKEIVNGKSNGTTRSSIDFSTLTPARRLGASSSGPKPLRFVHAIDLVSDNGTLIPSDDPNIIKFQYPASRLRERYQLVIIKDKIDPTQDILSAVQNIADFYLTESQAQPFTDPDRGFIRRLEKAINRESNPEFCSALADYNDAMRHLIDTGAISANLARCHDIPASLVHFVMKQCYDRAVAPKIEKVARYQPGTDYVYGELTSKFVTDLLINKTNMRSDQVFVDLGSGVGNVVLQAALEIGCESYGWEYQEGCCELAVAQLKEFKARCQLWGLSHGRVALGQGDFRKSEKVLEVLRRADVVLVNNQVFTSTLNDDLVRMFLDLKAGSKVISLKSFVHEGKGSNAHNQNDVAGMIFDVEEFTYPQEWVSWTASGGMYCISTRK